MLKKINNPALVEGKWSQPPVVFETLVQDLTSANFWICIARWFGFENIIYRFGIYNKKNVYAYLIFFFFCLQLEFQVCY